MTITEELEPLFKRIIKHALHPRSKVIDNEAKKRLREYYKNKNAIRTRGKNKIRLGKEGNKV